MATLSRFCETKRRMPSFTARSGTIHFEQRGSRANSPVVMIHGGGCQLIQWPDSLLDGIVAAGYRTIVFDNRGSGLSAPIAAPPPSFDQILTPSGAGAAQSAVTLADLAEDTVDLLDHIGQSGAHVIGFSMGGMIAQRMAFAHPERVHSLTLLMTSSGNPNLPNPEPQVVEALLAAQNAEGREAVIEASRALAKAIGGPHHDSTEHGIGRFAEAAYDRSYRPETDAHHFAAVASDGDKRAELRRLKCPVLIVHGNADPLIPVAAGEDIAANVTNATLEIIDGLGHDLPEPAIPQIVSRIVEHLQANVVDR